MLAVCSISSVSATGGDFIVSSQNNSTYDIQNWISDPINAGFSLIFDIEEYIFSAPLIINNAINITNGNSFGETILKYQGNYNMFTVTANNVNFTNLKINYTNGANVFNTAIFLKDNILNINNSNFSGSNTNIINVSINSSGNGALGVYAQNWYGNLVNSTINTKGDNGSGIISNNSIRGHIINSSINTSGFGAHGIYTNYFDGVVENTNINTFGISSYGVYLYYLFVNPNNFTNINSVNINTFGYNSIGVYTKNILFGSINNTDVSINGNAGAGIWAEYFNGHINNTTISNRGSLSHGFVYRGDTFNFKNSTISVGIADFLVKIPTINSFKASVSKVLTNTTVKFTTSANDANYYGFYINSKHMYNSSKSSYSYKFTKAGKYDVSVISYNNYLNIYDTKTTTITVESKPDLIISSFRKSKSNTYYVNIKNVGDASSKKSSLKMWYGKYYKVVSTPALAPGKSAKVKIVFHSKYSTKKYTKSVKVDYNNKVSERNENNNQKTIKK
ncbi:MAG: CARDB domain-containing protein [Methanobacteriaceae archaeon]